MPLPQLSLGLHILKDFYWVTVPTFGGGIINLAGSGNFFSRFSIGNIGQIAKNAGFS